LAARSVFEACLTVGQIGAGGSIEEFLADYPYLEREDI
jgi:uncharacterized protein (DUF433 family)